MFALVTRAAMAPIFTKAAMAPGVTEHAQLLIHLQALRFTA